MPAKSIAVFCTVVLLSLSQTPARAAIEYTLVDLRVLSGDTVGEIHPYVGDAINDLGQVAGYGYLVPDRVGGDDYTAHPYFYDPATGNFVNLGDIDGELGGKRKWGQWLRHQQQRMDHRTEQDQRGTGRVPGLLLEGYQRQRRLRSGRDEREHLGNRSGIPILYRVGAEQRGGRSSDTT